mgnify:CR=1 FL=1
MNWIRKVLEQNLNYQKEFKDIDGNIDIGIFIDYYKSIFLHHQHSMPIEENYLSYDEFQKERPIQKELKDYAYLYKWYPSDTEEEFRINCQSNNKLLLQREGWLNEDGTGVDIDYKINDYGFRCKNFSSEKGIGFFGCSITFGTGLNQEDTWPGIVSNHFNTECWNLAMPGKGLDYCAMFSAMFLQDILPNLQAICVYMPPSGRKSIIVETTEEDEYVSLQNINLDHDKYLNQQQLPVIPHNRFMKNDFNSEELLINLLWKSSNTFLNELGYTAILKGIADDYGIPFVMINELDVPLFTESADFARDLLHPGKNVHKTIAERILLDLQIDK